MLVLTAPLREALTSLNSVDDDTVADFCRVALQFLKDGYQPRLVDKAARKLEWPADKLQSVLQALMELIRRSVTVRDTRKELPVQLMDSGMLSSHAEIITEGIHESSMEILAVVSSASFRPLRYGSIDWRFEIQVASRTIQNIHKPLFFLELRLRTDHGFEVHTLQMDTPMLFHMIETIEHALSEGKSSHIRKLLRHVGR